MRTKRRLPTSSVCHQTCSMNFLARVVPRIRRKHTSYREPLEPDLKLSLTLRHLASGNKTVFIDEVCLESPHNTISVVVKVCQAIIDEYMDEALVCPTTPEEWHAIADKGYGRWNFPHTCGALDGKHVACRCPPKSGSLYFNYKGFYSIILLALVDASLSGLMLEVLDLHQMPKYTKILNLSNVLKMAP